MNFTPIHLKKDKIHSMRICIELSSPGKTIDGIAEIDDKDAISDAVKTINSIKSCVIPLGYESLSGDSPSAWINAYDESGNEIYSISFYNDILTGGMGYHKINYSEYDKLGKLCEKYGEFSEE